MGIGKRVAVVAVALAVGLGLTACGDDDSDLQDAINSSTAPAPPTPSRNPLEQEALVTFCETLKRQTGLDLATPEGASAAVAFFDELLQSAPSDIAEAVQVLRDSFQRIAVATPDQVEGIREEIRQPVTAAFTAVGGFQQSQCQKL